ncbi:MAG TPA: hypothetical protein VF860_04915 [Candidatus Acidoferrales bacterium]
MRITKKKNVSRRVFLKAAARMGLLTAAGGPFFVFPERAQASQKKLRVLQWKHFIPGYDKWFSEVFARDWGHKYDTKVIVDHVSREKIRHRAAAEAAVHKGHDLVMFLSPPAAHENDVIDHREIYLDLRHNWGETIELAHRSTYNPRTKKYFAFSDSYIPAPFNWLKDIWSEAGLPLGPIDYETLLRVGARIRRTRGIPCGFGLAGEMDSNIALRSILWSFGGRLQDEEGRVAVRSRNTVEALRFVKALYQETETPEMLAWKSDSNDKALLAARISCTINAISISREAEHRNPETSARIMLSPALKGPADTLSPPHVTQCYVIWSFAENKEGAKQFLIDLIGRFLEAFRASQFCNFPSFPKTVPDLLNQLNGDPSAAPKGKYAVLRDTLLWTKSIGYPGYSSAAIDEVTSTFVIPRVFAEVAKGALSPEEGAEAAEREIKQIFAQWQRG